MIYATLYLTMLDKSILNNTTFENYINATRTTEIYVIFSDCLGILATDVKS